jgi:7-cyano-7-deazaguanine synthase in queuosine biosynthesis
MKIRIPHECSQINVLFSGGVDSSLLLYLLTTQNTQNIPIHVFGMLKHKREQHFHDVLTWLETHLQVQYTKQLTTRFFFIRDFAKNTLDISPENSFTYSACNKVITDVFTPARYITGDTPPVRGPALNDHHLRPFIDVDKVMICEIYKQHSLQQLFTLTHSCGIDIENHCGECYFCMERNWGVAESNLFSV